MEKNSFQKNYSEFIKAVLAGNLRDAEALAEKCPDLRKNLELRVAKNKTMGPHAIEVFELRDLTGENIVLTSHDYFEPKLINFKLPNYHGNIQYLINTLEKLKITDYSVQTNWKYNDN